MARFTISEAAFTGFRVVRDNPIAVLIWAGVGLAINIGFSVLTIAMVGPAMNQLQSATATNPQDPTAALRIMSQLAPLYLLMLPLGLAGYAVLYATMNRVVLRPGDKAFGYLRLGADELRQAGVLLLTMVVFMGAYLALAIGGVIVAMILGIGLSAVAKGAAAVVPLLMVLVFLGIFGALIYGAVRLSLGSALTFDTGRVNLFGSWALTRGRFWEMFAAYLVAGIMSMIVGLVGFLVLGSIAFALGGGLGGLSGFMKPNMSTFGAYFTPMRIIIAVIYPLFYAVLMPISMTPPAAIYRALTADRQTGDVAAVFS